MGGKCCSDRKKRDSELAAGAKPFEAAVDHGHSGEKNNKGDPQKSGKATSGPDILIVRKSLAQNAYQKRTISDGDRAHGADAEKFDKAYASGDLKAFVELFPSQQTIEPLTERMHAWAEDPKTVGALSAMQFATDDFAALGLDQEHIDKKDVQVKGSSTALLAAAVGPLVDLLRSGEKDREQAAAIALSFLTTHNAANAKAAFKAGAMELLMLHMASPLGGMRSAAATTLCNMCLFSKDYTKEFVAQGGIPHLVEQLDCQSESFLALHLPDFQIEALMNVRILLEEVDGVVGNQAHAALAIEAGMQDKLQGLLNADDEDVQSCAYELGLAIEKVAR